MMKKSLSRSLHFSTTSPRVTKGTHLPISYECNGANANYRSLHSEGRVLTSLFALLFFDIIFTPLEGAFETRYQSAPLDIGSDTFYHSRRTLMDQRLADIASGQAEAIALATWDREYKDKTWCIGLRWDLLEREDWVEILECWNYTALALVCKTLVEDYVNRTAGVPDLFVWNVAERKCKFVEVKGPGDNLQENQKVRDDNDRMFVMKTLTTIIGSCGLMCSSRQTWTLKSATSPSLRSSPSLLPCPNQFENLSPSQVPPDPKFHLQRNGGVKRKS